MAAIVWGNRIRDYYITLGYTSAYGTLVQTYVNRMTTQFADVAEDTSLVKMLEANINPILGIAASVYGLGYNAGTTTTYINTNYPAYAGVSTLYGNVIVTDINTNLVGTPAASGYYAAKDVYKLGIAAVFTSITKNMRYFAGMAVIPS